VAEGTLYFVGANLEYTMDGERYEIPVAPDDIFVRPMPELALDYFLPRNVHANDPFTDEIEPPEPFTLGVRVQNFGDGPARDVAIDSAQPEIVENDQGLAIDFEILGGQVNDQPASPSLSLEFGDIPANGASVGRWEMIASLSGRLGSTCERC